jgi:type I restriction enzyme S subunit
MGSEWPEVTLAEISERIGDGLHGTPTYSEYGEYYFINGNNLESGEITIKESTKKVDSEQYLKHKKTLNSNAVLVSINGTIGNVALYNGEEVVLGKSACYINFKHGIHRDFVAYALSSHQFQEYIERCATGSTIKNVSLKMMREFKFKMPSEEKEQIKAVSSIRSIDQKIQLNRQTNQTLEKMAQALFKSWFVDFDSVIDNALEAGNPIPEELQDRAERRKKQLAKPDHKPLPEDIRQLFPNEFELTDELGWVPKGWDIKSIKDLATVVKGKSYRSTELKESKTALVTLKSFMRGGGYRLDGLKEYTGSYKPEQEVFAGDLVIAYTDVTQAADVIGKPAMVITDSRYDHLVISLDVAVVRTESDDFKYFLYGLTQTKNFQEHTYSHSTGTTVLHLGKTAVPEYNLAKPSNKILDVYINMVKPKYQSIDKNIQSTRVLEKLRDTLLPKLISGELRLPSEALAEADQQLAETIAQ